MRPTLCLAAAAGPRVPVEVVVLPFSDGTEDFVEGTLLKAYGPPGEWALALRARRIGDQRPAWERQVSRTFERWDMSQLHPWLNRAMQEMFEEAGADLARTLAGQPAGAPGPASGPAPAPPAGAPPVDETIRKILEER
jgi:hypothetical protein